MRYDAGQFVCVSNLRGDVLMTGAVVEWTDDSDTQIANVEQWLRVKCGDKIVVFRREGSATGARWTPKSKSIRGDVKIFPTKGENRTSDSASPLSRAVKEARGGDAPPPSFRGFA